MRYRHIPRGIFTIFVLLLVAPALEMRSNSEEEKPEVSAAKVTSQDIKSHCITIAGDQIPAVFVADGLRLSKEWKHFICSDLSSILAHFSSYRFAERKKPILLSNEPETYKCTHELDLRNQELETTDRVETILTQNSFGIATKEKGRYAFVLTAGLLREYNTRKEILENHAGIYRKLRQFVEVVSSREKIRGSISNMAELFIFDPRDADLKHAFLGRIEQKAHSLDEWVKSYRMPSVLALERAKNSLFGKHAQIDVRGTALEDAILTVLQYEDEYGHWASWPVMYHEGEWQFFVFSI